MLERLSLAIVDVETTGVSVTGDRVIEIAVQRIERGAVTRTFESLVDPEQPLDPFIQRLTGIRQQDLDGAPTFGAIHDEVSALLAGCVFVAHNVGFDYGLVQSEFARLGKSFEATRLCSVRLSKRLYPRYKRHNLDEVIKRFRLTCERRHRALGDVQMVWAFLQAAYRNRGPAKFSAAVTELLLAPAPAPPARSLGLPAGP